MMPTALRISSSSLCLSSHLFVLLIVTSSDGLCTVTWCFRSVGRQEVVGPSYPVVIVARTGLDLCLRRPLAQVVCRRRHCSRLGLQGAHTLDGV